MTSRNKSKKSALAAGVAAEIRELIELFYHGDSYELAMRLGASCQSVYGWRSGTNLPSRGRLAKLIELCDVHGLPAPAMRRALGEAKLYTMEAVPRPSGLKIVRFDERQARCILRVGPPGGSVTTPDGRVLDVDREKLLGITSLCLDCCRPPGECSFCTFRVLPAGAEFFSFLTSMSDGIFYKITHCPRFRPPEGFGSPEQRRQYLAGILGGVKKFAAEEKEQEKKKCI